MAGDLLARPGLASTQLDVPGNKLVATCKTTVVTYALITLHGEVEIHACIAHTLSPMQC